MIVVMLAVSVYVAWRGVQRERAQLQEKLKTAADALQAANAREQARKTELEEQLADLQKKKAEVQKPEQVVKALPEVLPLPKPLVVEEPPQSPAAGQSSGEGKPDSPSPRILLPVEDLKPLYDLAVACKECQAELVAARGDLADERVKTQTLSRKRDSALQAARGGSVLRRVARAAKWFAIGEAAGVVAAKLAK